MGYLYLAVLAGAIGLAIALAAIGSASSLGKAVTAAMEPSSSAAPLLRR